MSSTGEVVRHKMYVVNATQQIRQFTFWLKGAPRALVQEVPIGGQTLVAGRELSVTDIEHVIQQHAPYGLVEVSEALRSRGTFDGVAYSLDKPVPYDRIVDLVDRYNGVMNERGKELRAAAAIATNDYIETNLRENGVPARLQTLEQTVEEVERDHRDTSPEVAAGVRVVREPGDSRPALRGRARPTRK